MVLLSKMWVESILQSNLCNTFITITVMDLPDAAYRKIWTDFEALIYFKISIKKIQNLCSHYYTIKQLLNFKYFKEIF